MIKARLQRGITIIEFTIVASTMLLIVLGILEMGLFLFNMQSLNDLTRRTARIAAVCQVSDVNIKTLAFKERVPDGLTPSNLNVEYLDSTGTKVDDPTLNQNSIKYVQAYVSNFDYGFSGILSFLGNNGVISLPNFKTILPAESLGIGRPDPVTDAPLYINCK